MLKLLKVMRSKFLDVLLIGTFTVCATYTATEIAGARITVDAIPAISVSTPQELVVDVALRQRDIIHVESHWPDSFEVTNITEDKNITGVRLDIMANDDEGGPGRYVGWGTNPETCQNTASISPGGSLTIQIPAEVVYTFQRNGKPFLWVQVSSVWVNNDPSVMYGRGLELRRTANGQYTVAVDDKGRIRDPKNPSKVIGLAPDADSLFHAHAKYAKGRGYMSISGEDHAIAMDPYVLDVKTRS